MRKRVARVAFLLAAMVLGTAVPGWAGYWNVGDDFSATNNPNGVWSYGDYGGGSPSGTLNPATFTLLTYLGHGYGSIDAWEMPGPNNPVVSHNSSLTNTVGSFSDPTTYTTQWLPNEVALHPLDGPTVVRWTAPAAGEYQVSGDFFPTQGVNSPANAYIYVDSTQDALGSVSSTVPFSLLLNLHAGDTVDFVAWGGNAYNKTTGLAASISSSVPEPSSLVGLLSIGVAGIVGNIWRRRRRR
jgi:hypothetical protein